MRQLTPYLGQHRGTIIPASSRLRAPAVVDRSSALSQTSGVMDPFARRQQAIYKMKRLFRLYLWLVAFILLWPIVLVPGPFRLPYTIEVTGAEGIPFTMTVRTDQGLFQTSSSTRSVVGVTPRTLTAKGGRVTVGV